MVAHDQKIEKDDVIMEDPNFLLRDLLGPDVELRKIFTPEKIKDCQKLIDEARDEFFLDEIKKVAEIKKIALLGDENALKSIVFLGQDLKSQARLFGFGFIANICTQIIFYAETNEKSFPARLNIISKFLDALEHAMKHRLKDETGQLEKNLMSILST